MQAVRFAADVTYGPNTTVANEGDVVFVRLGDDKHYVQAAIRDVRQPSRPTMGPQQLARASE